MTTPEPRFWLEADEEVRASKREDSLYWAKERRAPTAEDLLGIDRE